MTDWEKFEFFLKVQHNLTPDDIEPAPAHGYWKIKKPCNGIRKSPMCKNPIHMYLGCADPIQHTVHYYDEPRDRKTGRFASPYRTWREFVRRWMILEANGEYDGKRTLSTHSEGQAG